MNLPHYCPICTAYRVRTNPQDCDITSQFQFGKTQVQGFASFACENGHVFFVRVSDLDNRNGNSLATAAKAPGG